MTRGEAEEALMAAIARRTALRAQLADGSCPARRAMLQETVALVTEQIKALARFVGPIV